MFLQPEFSIETCDETRLGRLSLPGHHIAEWINFLLETQHQSKIILAQQHSQGITLYFQASERVYAYLGGRFNCQIAPIHPETTEIGQELKIHLQDLNRAQLKSHKN